MEMPKPWLILLSASILTSTKKTGNTGHPKQNSTVGKAQRKTAPSLDIHRERAVFLSK
jgi:hypothetical protein